MESQTKRVECEVLEFWKQLNVRIQTLECRKQHVGQHEALPSKDPFKEDGMAPINVIKN
jgi:uncharacterized protein YqcC (DUF446 family)